MADETAARRARRAEVRDARRDLGGAMTLLATAVDRLDVAAKSIAAHVTDLQLISRFDVAPDKWAALDAAMVDVAAMLRREQQHMARVRASLALLVDTVKEAP